MHQEVVLGFLDTPKNFMLMKPEFTPSKIGGEAAFIYPDNLPPMKCPHCGMGLSFLCQIYANHPSKSHYDYHRMLYVFVCVSEKCIST